MAKKPLLQAANLLSGYESSRRQEQIQGGLLLGCSFRQSFRSQKSTWKIKCRFFFDFWASFENECSFWYYLFPFCSSESQGLAWSSKVCIFTRFFFLRRIFATCFRDCPGFPPSILRIRAIFLSTEILPSGIPPLGDSSYYPLPPGPFEVVTHLWRPLPPPPSGDPGPAERPPPAPLHAAGGGGAHGAAPMPAAVWADGAVPAIPRRLRWARRPFGSWGRSLPDG